MIELEVLGNDPIELEAVDDGLTELAVMMPTTGGGALSDEVKQAILNCFEHVAWVDEYGQDYYDALYNAFYPPAGLVSISAVYTQSGTVYDTASLDSLKNDLVVTAHYSDSSTEVVTNYALSGTLVEGTSTITVTYGGKTATFNVTVTHEEVVVLESISAVYTQSGTVYDTDSLDSLKADLVVTATYSDSTTATVPSTDYTLSGTLAVGTSTITVSYGGKTTTFIVTVSGHTIAVKGYTIGPLSGSVNIGLSMNNNRAGLVSDAGVHAYPKHSGTLADNYYPIPIPSGATRMVVTMPSALYVGVRTFIWNSAQSYYDNTNGLSSSWTASNESTFDVSTYNDGTWFTGLTFKVGTAGTTDMRNYDMSGVSISFE